MFVMSEDGTKREEIKEENHELEDDEQDELEDDDDDVEEEEEQTGVQKLDEFMISLHNMAYLLN